MACLTGIRSNPLPSHMRAVDEDECNRDLDEAAVAADAIACSGAAVSVG